MVDRPASPTFFSTAIGSYAEPAYNSEFSPLGSPALQNSALPFSADLSQYFPFPPSPNSPDNGQWTSTKPESHQPSGLPDLDGMNFGDNSQSLPAWPGAKMEQTLTDFPMRQPSPLTSLLTNGSMQTSTRGRHGQITPPSDSNPSSPVWKPASFQEPSQLTTSMGSPGKSSVQHRGSQESTSTGGNNPTSSSSPPRKRTQASSPTTEISAPKRRRNQTRKASSAENLSQEESEKRKKFLERNRVAASKCRQKKKQWYEQLRNSSFILYDEGNQKRRVVKQLRDEIIQLKTQILNENRCNCPGLIDYINREANSITDRFYPTHSQAGHPDSPTLGAITPSQAV